MKNKKVFDFLNIVINVFMSTSMIMIGGYIGIKGVDLEFAEFSYNLMSVAIGIALLYFISIIWHELGHLLFGIIAKLDFIAFSIFNIVITKKNNKLVVNIAPTMPGVGGYCNMVFNENIEYCKTQIVLYYLGGIIFNFILAIIFSILFVFCNNMYLSSIALAGIITNVCLGLSNSIPSTIKAGNITDMLHIINCFKDPEYINMISKCLKIQNLILGGCEIKDIDEELVHMPNDFSNTYKVIMAQYYIDYIAEKHEYKEAIECTKTVLEKAKDTLHKSYINLFKVNLILYAFKDNCDLGTICEYWDEELRKYLELIENVAPQCLGINYMYSSLIEKDKKKAQKYLNKFEKIKKKHPDKKAIEETEKMISDVNERKVKMDE